MYKDDVPQDARLEGLVELDVVVVDDVLRSSLGPYDDTQRKIELTMRLPFRAMSQMTNMRLFFGQVRPKKGVKLSICNSRIWMGSSCRREGERWRMAVRV